MTMITINGKGIFLVPMSFKALKDVWPSILAFGGTMDRIQQGDLAVDIFAKVMADQGLPGATKEEIEQSLMGAEFIGLIEALPELLRDSGLISRNPDAGEQPAGEAAAAGS